MLTVGAEEEFFIVNAESRELAPAEPASFDFLKEAGLPGRDLAGFDNEFQAPIVETRTGVCASLAEFRSDLTRLRQILVAAADAEALAVVASGTLPTGRWHDVAITDKARYHDITEHYHDVVTRRLTCGLHIHVGISSTDLAVSVLNRVQVWLPALLALSASSPFFSWRNTGYASYRYTLWGGFPVAGATPRFASYEQYASYIRMLIETSAILDAGHVYWDTRLGTRFPTLEFRIADACPSVDDAVLQAGLCRALVLTCLHEIERDEPESSADPFLLRAANWHAGRWGLSRNLIDAAAWQEVPAAVLIDRLIAHVRDALDELGDHAEVSRLALRATTEGNSAIRQRVVHAATGSLCDITDMLIAQTRENLGVAQADHQASVGGLHEAASGLGDASGQ